MKIIWDERKRLANLAKHGMDFADLNETFFDTALVLATYRNRWRAIGVNVRGVISVICHAWHRSDQHRQHASRQQG